MKRWSLHGAYAGATLAALLTGATAEPARAHVQVQPGVVAQGEVVELQVELPQLRPGPAPTALELEAPNVEVLSTRLVGSAGAETRWRARVRAVGPPGAVPVVLRALYADGRSVEVDQTLTIVPAAVEQDFPWPAAVAGALLAVAFAATALLLARRRE